MQHITSKSGQQCDERCALKNSLQASGAYLQEATLIAPWLCPVKCTRIFIELNAFKLIEQNAQFPSISSSRVFRRVLRNI